jgi:membrane fusion protein, copper/silver efflux system
MTPAKYIGGCFMAVCIFCAGYLANRQNDPATVSASVQQTAIYACPMHPQYRSDHAGDCPICGMRLELATAQSIGVESDSFGANSPGAVQVDAAKQQLMGVRTDEIRRDSSSHMLRVPGRITVDDQRLYRIISATDGWILDLESNAAGRFVKKDQLLATYYTRDLLGTERLYLLSLGTSDTSQKGDLGTPSMRVGTSLIPQYPIDNLRGLGMSDLQIDEIRKNHEAVPSINIYSPVTGFVLTRNVSPQQRFDKGTEFYRIADISHVWVMTDIFEKDRTFVNPGASATIRYQGREFQARRSNALPQLDPQTRTLKTRFELDNPGNTLLPDMFVDVELSMNTPESITIPADAVIDSGRKKTVYVERTSGVFEPRLVETGWRLGDRVQITQGLEPGERIVVSGNFLIDSESRMKMPGSNKATTTEKAKTAIDPVCGMNMDPKASGTVKTEYKGETYYFCCENCKKRFEAEPEKYISKKSSGTESEATKDPVCNMGVDPKTPDVVKTEYRGETYYFCSEDCKKSFEANPERYARRMADEGMHGIHTSE